MKFWFRLSCGKFGLKEIIIFPRQRITPRKSYFIFVLVGVVICKPLGPPFSSPTIFFVIRGSHSSMERFFCFLIATMKTPRRQQNVENLEVWPKPFVVEYHLSSAQHELICSYINFTWLRVSYFLLNNFSGINVSILWRFTSWGERTPHRPVEDLAFSVARFFQREGSFQNYYMVCEMTVIWGSFETLPITRY